MEPKDKEFLRRLRATFKVEAREHLQTISKGLEEIERTAAEPQQKELIEAIFRTAHSLKGAARSVNAAEIEAVCQSMENVMAALNKRTVTASTETLAVLHQAVDALDSLLETAEPDGRTETKTSTAALIRRLDIAAQGRLASLPQESVLPTPVSESPSNVASGPRAETIRVAATRLDALLVQAEEMLAVKLMSGHRASQIKNLLKEFRQWHQDWSRVVPQARRARQLMEQAGNGSRAQLSKAGLQATELTGMLEFLDQNQTFIQMMEGALSRIAMETEQEHRATSVLVDNLLSDVKQTVMVPFSSVVEGFPKLVRSLAQAEGKEAELIIHGEHIEMDRRMLEGLKDPMVHVLRNSIDHGLEKPDERARQRKPPRGTITIAVSQHSSARIEILISDDGRGIDLSRVRETAIKRGLISQAEAEQLSAEEVTSFIFHSGFSTSSVISDISGRGLGLAILQDKVEKLGGALSVESHVGRGATFRLIVPLTVATFRAVLVSAGGQRLAVPTNSVERVLRVDKTAIKTVENRETIEMDQRVLLLARLSDALEINQRERRQNGEEISAIVINVAGNRVALRVDEVLEEQEVLVKSLGRQLARVRNIAGAAVLGTGQLVPVLNVRDLLKSALRLRAAPIGSKRRAEKTKRAKTKTILLAEDSITARVLLRNILESAGYSVQTAIDGVDAFTRLKTEAYDLLVSDVEMPRMNGFELTSRVRADKTLSDLPVILVTALASREDRERGVEAGANAYIVKSSFDQSNLIEVITRLI